MPNFLILGAAKTGTTSIYRYLRQHPQIYMSPAKEPRFFIFEGETLDFNGPGDKEEIAKTSLESYQQLFSKVKDEIAIGEATTMYLWSAKAAQKIKHYIPDAKLIVFVRDPVNRAYSNYLHLVQAGREPLSNFAEAIQQEPQRMQNKWWPFWYYKDQGFYYTQLKRYLDLFARDRLKVYLYEDLKSEPLALIQNIFRFLAVDDRFIPDLSEKVRISRPIPKNKTLDLLFSQPNPLKSFFKPFIPKNIRQQVTNNIKQKNLIEPKVSPEIRQQLINEYRDDILKLQDLIGRDLSHWLRV